MTDENIVNELIKAESVLAQSYAFLLCTAVNSDIRTKLSYNQR